MEYALEKLWSTNEREDRPVALPNSLDGKPCGGWGVSPESVRWVRDEPQVERLPPSPVDSLGPQVRQRRPQLPCTLEEIFRTRCDSRGHGTRHPARHSSPLLPAPVRAGNDSDFGAGVLSSLGFRCRDLTRAQPQASFSWVQTVGGGCGSSVTTRGSSHATVSPRHPRSVTPVPRAACTGLGRPARGLR